MTVIPLGFVPLTFAFGIVRYRLRDVEVIVKRGLAYAAFLGASAALYVAMRRLAGFFFAEDQDPRNWVVAILATLAVVLLLQPVKEAVQNALDRLFYRDRYDYRRALVGFARDLNADLDVMRLSQRLVSRIVETLVVDRMALMLADERSRDFAPISDFGFSREAPHLSRGSSLIARLDAGYTVALDDPIAAARFVAEEVEFWRDAGIHYFVPCVFEGRAIAVLALGRKDTDQPFNSEDLALLTAVAGQAATSIENGRLYRQLHLKAEELDGLREFNENILESLDDGLVVFDGAERIVRWNRALEAFYGVTRADAIDRTLADVFEATFVEALRAERRENPSGSTLFRVPLTGRHEDAARAARQRHGGPAPGCAGRRRGGRRNDPADREHHRPGPAGRAAAAVREDGVDRRAGGGRCPRGQHAVDRHLELHADAARERRSERPEHGAAGEDRTADLPRGEDRERPAEPVASRHRSRRPGANDRRSQHRHLRRVLAARASVRDGQGQGQARAVRRRRCRSSASSISCSRCS